MYFGKIQTETNARNNAGVVNSLLECPFSRRNNTERKEVLNKERDYRDTTSLIIFLTHNLKTRVSIASWYGQHKWLSGNVVQNKLLCWPCSLLSREKIKRKERKGNFNT